MCKNHWLVFLFFVIFSGDAFSGDFDANVFESAQKFVRHGDYEEAFGELEPLLDDLTGEPEKDALLFMQLSEIAELKRDIPAAVRFQEQACERIDSPAENRRLFVLYRKNKENKKARESLLRSLEKTKFEDIIPSIDILLRYDEYDAANQVVESLEKAKIEDWNIPYRRLMVEFWSGRLPEAKKVAEEIIPMKLADEKPISKAPEVGPKGELLPRASRWMTQRYLQPQTNYNDPRYPFWEFKGSYGHTSDEGVIEIRKKWIAQSNELMMTIFRDKIHIRHPEIYGESDTETIHPKPLFVPETADDARFAARLWLLRIAFQNDIEASGDKAVPENGRTLKLLNVAVENLRNEFPLDSPDNEKLVTRLRLETFFCEWCMRASGNQFFNSDFITVFYPESFGEVDETHLEPHMRGKHSRVGEFFGRFCAQIQSTLGMRGEIEWSGPGYMITLNDLLWEREREKLESFDLDQEFEKAMKKHPSLREKLAEEDIAKTKLSIQGMIKVMRKNSERIKTINPASKKQKIDFLIRCWDELDKHVFSQEKLSNEGDWNIGYLYEIAMATRTQFESLLKTEARTADLERINRMLDSAMQKHPGILEHYIESIRFRMPENTGDDSVFHSLDRIQIMQFLHGMSFHQLDNEIKSPKFGRDGSMKMPPLLHPILVPEGDNSKKGFEQRFLDTMAKIEEYDLLMKKYQEAVGNAKKIDPSVDTRNWDRFSVDWRIKEVLEQHIMANTNRLVLFVGERNEIGIHEIENVTITGENLEEIARIEEDSYRVLDYYFSRFKDDEQDATFRTSPIIIRFRQFPRMLDQLLEKAKPLGEIEPEFLKANHTEKLKHYLEKIAHDK